MENKEFKKIFSEVAKTKGFQYIHGIWCLESNECIFVIELQKSNFGNFYYLNMKIFIQGIFEKKYLRDRELKKDPGDIFLRPPGKYQFFFDLDIDIDPMERKKGLEMLFSEYLIPFSKKALSRRGVRALGNEKEVIIQPGIEKELSRLT